MQLFIWEPYNNSLKRQAVCIAGCMNQDHNHAFRALLVLGVLSACWSLARCL